jgi:hypothetical protein
MERRLEMFGRFNARRAQSRRDGPIVAWHEVPGTGPPPKSRPVGHGMIGRRPNPRGVFCRKGVPFFFRKVKHSKHRIAAPTGANQTVPLRDGSFEVALSRALRARLRSDRPSGTEPFLRVLSLPNTSYFAPFGPRLKPQANSYTPAKQSNRTPKV